MKEKIKRLDELNGLEKLSLEHLLWIRISQVQHVIKHTWAKKMEEINLSPEKFLVIHELFCLGGESTPHAIARRVIFEANTISAILSRMEKDGYVTKTKDLGKKHMVRVKLTKKAIDVYPKALAMVQERTKGAMAGITKAEKKRMLKYLVKVIEDPSFDINGGKKNLTPFIVSDTAPK